MYRENAEGESVSAPDGLEAQSTYVLQAVHTSTVWCVLCTLYYVYTGLCIHCIMYTYCSMYTYCIMYTYCSMYAYCIMYTYIRTYVPW